MMRAPAEPPDQPVGALEVAVQQMRHRHVRDVLTIERLVYPRPWSAALFFSELAQRSTRTYLVALHRRTIAGYGGLMCNLDEGHVTTLAVAPEYQHRKVGSRVLLALVDDALARGMRTLGLEVRVANWPAQRLYSWFGFRPVGIRKNYYAETGEDALVMYVDDLRSGELAARLERIRAGLAAS